MSGNPDPLYVAARKVLLDALECLADHREGMVLVGAQAVYVHTGGGDLAVAPYTEDADIALNPSALSDEPLIEGALLAAGFVHRDGPGQWIGPGDVPVDLMVPESLAGRGRRAARIPPHADYVARRAGGLEAALVDNALVELSAFDSADQRVFEIRVAGPAALLVAKAHKLRERLGDRRRSSNKDALDAYRLLRDVQEEIMLGGYRRLIGDDISKGVSIQALDYLEELFLLPQAEGLEMLERAIAALTDAAQHREICRRLVERLRTRVRA